ncbi:hypothetical protein [Streptomyces nanshensis]|uniref:Uncharacterized protein n=1 Tax=Streptomyces nanshensis TaxID=518642 RepID=A0A1E7L408_9ACTN|nr:hypothetical protein [Streptomyces nanshensis]OEV10919.1 hypothetical protein AN218_15380 [Streptomyces nanshensis]
MPSARMLPGLSLTDQPVDTVLNWGLGVESTAALVEILDGPAAHGIDLDRFAVLHNVVGSEWPDTLADCERHILPLLRRHGVRLVQVARAGQSNSAGIEVLDDSHSPEQLVSRGSWALWDELESNGTVPQQGGKRLCSIRSKGEVGDRWIPTVTDGRPFTQIIGFSADEEGRKARDLLANRNPLRTGRFPLIDWGWTRRMCERFLLERFDVQWRKSYCWFCCYPVSMGAMADNLQRMRMFPEIAGRVLRLEYTAMALNSKARLFGRRSLLEQFDPGVDAPVLKAFERELAGAWGIYHVRRILPVSRTNPDVRAPALRSVELLDRGPSHFVGGRLQGISRRHRVDVETDPYGSVRGVLRRRGNGLPAVEEFMVTAPACVRDKKQGRFEEEWARHTARRTQAALAPHAAR